MLPIPLHLHLANRNQLLFLIACSFATMVYLQTRLLGTENVRRGVASEVWGFRSVVVVIVKGVYGTLLYQIRFHHLKTCTRFFIKITSPNPLPPPPLLSRRVYNLQCVLVLYFNHIPSPENSHSHNFLAITSYPSYPHSSQSPHYSSLANSRSHILSPSRHTFCLFRGPESAPLQLHTPMQTLLIFHQRTTCRPGIKPMER